MNDDLNLAKWIDRRSVNLNPYSTYIVREVEYLEDEIRKLRRGFRIIAAISMDPTIKAVAEGYVKEDDYESRSKEVPNDGS